MKLTLSMFTVVLAATAASLHAATLQVGASAPDFVLKSVAGTNVRISEHRGEIVLLAFTASWCGECRTQIEHLADIHGRYSEAGVVLIGVGLDRDRSAAAGITERLDGDFPMLHDLRGEAGGLYDVDVVPTLVLIDRRGVVRDVIAGYRRGDERTYLERVRGLLREL